MRIDEKPGSRDIGDCWRGSEISIIWIVGTYAAASSSDIHCKCTAGMKIEGEGAGG